MIHRSSRQGLETLLIDTPLARCEIALFGAQVLSFVPRHDGRDLLWCSDARLAPARPFRGGIPVCWPWFARQGVAESAPQHGFVRTLPWRVVSIEEAADSASDGRGGGADASPDKVTIVMAPDDAAFAVAAGIADWPADCTPTLTVAIGRDLTVTLATLNRSEQTLTLTQALHTYFRVGDVAAVGVDGLQGLNYLDKLSGFAEFTQSAAWTFEGACDRIYLQSGPQHAIHDPILGRRVDIHAEGSASTVVWNPGADGVRAFEDIPPGDWFQYLCIEAANCGPLNIVALEPGEQVRLVQRLAVDG
jgi:glucose-6-phosphate 1-epimerase